MAREPNIAFDVDLASGEPFVVPEAHRAAVLEGFDQARSAEFVSEDEMAALWKKCGL